MTQSIVARAMTDITAGLKKYPLVGMLGWQDVKQRYRRSKVGPFWITLSMGVMIATIGIVFSQIFKSPIAEFLPFLAIGMIIWTFMSTVITEGCLGFVSAESIIKQLPVPLFVHILRLLWRNLIILGHNLIIIPIVFLAFGKPLHLVALLAIPGMLVLLFNLAWMTLILAVLCTRYRDLPQIIASVMQIIYFLTPIMWLPSLLPSRSAAYLLDLNPVYHLLEIVRAPILGSAPAASNWTSSVLMALIGWSIAIVLYGRYKNRISYWL